MDFSWTYGSQEATWLHPAYPCTWGDPSLPKASTNAILILAGTISGDLRVKESRILWHDPTYATEGNVLKEGLWKAIPNIAPEAAVKDIVPDVEASIARCGEELDYCLTQVFIGHEAFFQSFLHKIDQIPLDIYLCRLHYGLGKYDMSHTGDFHAFTREKHIIGEMRLSLGKGLRSFTSFIIYRRDYAHETLV